MTSEHHPIPHSFAKLGHSQEANLHVQVLSLLLGPRTRWGLERLKGEKALFYPHSQQNSVEKASASIPTLKLIAEQSVGELTSGPPRTGTVVP
jgi:hypothetical protein